MSVSELHGLAVVNGDRRCSLEDLTQLAKSSLQVEDLKAKSVLVQGLFRRATDCRENDERQ